MGPGASLYESLLGPAWARLDPAVRLAHDGRLNRRGTLRIAHGRGVVARILAVLLRLPRAHEAVDTTLRVTPAGDAEIWVRSFDGRRISSRQYATADGQLAEKIGPLEFCFRLQADAGSLVFRQSDVACILGRLRLSIPDVMAPRIAAREDPAGAGAVTIQVHLTTATAGTVLTYEGLVQIESAPA